MNDEFLKKFNYLDDKKIENGAWFEISYDYQYGNEVWNVDDYKTEIFAYSRKEAVEKFIENKSDDFKKRVLSACIYSK